jgi:hypothetical protein
LLEYLLEGINSSSIVFAELTILMLVVHSIPKIAIFNLECSPTQKNPLGMHHQVDVG